MALNSLLSFGTGSLSPCFVGGLDRHGKERSGGKPDRQSFGWRLARIHKTA